MAKRILSSIIDEIIVLFFSFMALVILENASGMIFDFHFIDENSTIANVRIFVGIFLIVHFLYSLTISFGGTSVGKRFCEFCIKAGSIRKSIIKEVGLKWGFFLCLPLLIACANAKIGFLILLFLCIIYTIVSIVTWRKRKQSAFDALLDLSTQQSDYAKFHLSILALLIDACIIFVITVTLHLILSCQVPVEFFTLLYIVIFVYLLVSALLNGKTFGKQLFQLQLEKSSVRSLLIRELVFKFGLVLVVPFLILSLLFNITSTYATFLWSLGLGGFAMVLYYAKNGCLWWTKLTDARFETQHNSRKQRLIAAVTCFFVICMCFEVSRHVNNNHQDNDMVTLGFEYPLDYQIPSRLDVCEYSQFLQDSSILSAKDYVLSLFKKYDVVIIGETYHGEKTQWDFFFDIVSDKYFIDNVGVVFTEYGSAIHQNKVDDFLKTSFSSDTMRLQQCATIMDFMSGGFYNFLVELNQLNSKLPDSLKIRNYFTDIIDYDYFPATYKSRTPNLDNRDSLMAQVTIDWYNKSIKYGGKHKCLVITNFRHAFGYPQGMSLKNEPHYLNFTSGNQGQFLFESLSGKVANVLQHMPNANRKIFFMPFVEPIQHGKWDKAFENAVNKTAGFNLLNTPFGDDEMDLYPLRGASTNHKFQEYYTGLVFVNKYSDIEEIGYPFRQYAAKQEMLQKNDSLNASDEAYINMYYSDQPQITNNIRRTISRINYIEILSLILVSLFGGVLSLYGTLKK
ncbi:MAG: RDD family protein [Salinivirgaceae bacterium]|nr:RDD family protein [Salinivirgaceae bacterium]